MNEKRRVCKMKKKKKKIFPRIPQEIWESYRKRGGPHGTPKGKRGYKRQAEKQKLEKEKSES